jgi:hypothetical protein
VIGSQLPSSSVDPPQHPLLPPLVTRRAASPYFSFTISFNSMVFLFQSFSVLTDKLDHVPTYFVAAWITVGSYLQSWTMACGSIALLRVQHSA